MTERWEYKAFNFDKVGFLTGKFDMPELESLLNEHGREGWEVVSATPQISRLGRSIGLVVVLKKPR